MYASIHTYTSIHTQAARCNSHAATQKASTYTYIIHTYIHRHTHVCIHPYIHIHTYIHRQGTAPSTRLSCSYTIGFHIHIHNTYTHTHVCIHPYIHTYTYIRRQGTVPSTRLSCSYTKDSRSPLFSCPQPPSKMARNLKLQTRLWRQSNLQPRIKWREAMKKPREKAPNPRNGRCLHMSC